MEKWNGMEWNDGFPKLALSAQYLNIQIGNVSDRVYISTRLSRGWGGGYDVRMRCVAQLMT